MIQFLSVSSSILRSKMYRELDFSLFFRDFSIQFQQVEITRSDKSNMP